MSTVMSLRARLLLVGVLFVAVPLAVITATVLVKQYQMQRTADVECRVLATQDLDHTVQLIREMCVAEQTSRSMEGADEGHPELRRAINQLVIGKTGYVFVVDSKGRYIVSKDGKRDGEIIWGSQDNNGNHFIQDIVRKAHALPQNQIGEQVYSWLNAGEATPRDKLARFVYFEPWDWIIAAGAYDEEIMVAATTISDRARECAVLISIVAAVSLILATVAWSLVATKIGRALERTAATLAQSSAQVNTSSSQVAATSQQLAEGASEQAASLEEVSASLTEISAMTDQTAISTAQTSEQAAAAARAARHGVDAMEHMNRAIQEIKTTGDETAKILKTIDEIAFQTNLLALNAAVEAARAGGAGKGFAVVAEEVRTLAQRSAEAARNTGSLIARSRQSSENGIATAGEVNTALQEILANVTTVRDQIDQVSAASRQQALGVNEVNEAVAQLDQVTQSNAASAEEAAAAGQDLNNQAAAVDAAVTELEVLTNGARRG